MKNYVTHLECALTGEKKEKNQVHGLSNVGKPLLVRYDLKEIKKDIQKNDLKLNEIEGLWRYAFLLPVDK